MTLGATSASCAGYESVRQLWRQHGGLKCASGFCPLGRASLVLYVPVDVERLGMKEIGPSTIRVVDYDPSWPATFETLKSRVLQALGTLTVQVEHVGSTSVPGLAAKPIIDMDIVVAAPVDVPLAIEQLSTLGTCIVATWASKVGKPLATHQDCRHTIYTCAPRERPLWPII
jgi:hypothetical protein